MSPLERGSGQGRPGEVRLPEVSSRKIGPAKTGSIEGRSAQGRGSQGCSTEDGLHEVRAGEIGSTQVRLALQVAGSPPVPDPNSFFEQAEVPSIRHRLCLCLWPLP